MFKTNKIIFTLIAFVVISSVQLSTYAGSVQDYLDQVPGIGLILDEVNFNGVTLKNLKFEKNEESDDLITDKYVITKPESEHFVYAEYEIDSEVLETLQFHHFIYGLHNDGPQDCLLHSFGLADAKGALLFKVVAPKKPGVYQLRFCHAEGYGTFEEVKDEWWKDDSATAKTIMGIVIVEDL